MNKRLQKYIPKAFLSLSLLLLPAFTGCRENRKEYRIGVAQPSDDEWRRQMNDEILRETLLHDNMKVEIRSADDDNARQIADLEYFARNNFDIIIVAPNEADALTPAVRKIWQQGIPVIVFDRNINDTSYTARIDMNNVGIGKAAGDYALSLHKTTGGKILELTGLPGSTPAEERHKGFADALRSLPKDDFAGSFHADWTGAPAARLTDSIIAANPDIRIIYAHNDIMAIAAANAAKKAGRKDIIVIGTDGAPSPGLKAVADSDIYATITYPTVGEEVMTIAREIAEGRPVRKEILSDHEMLIDRTNADIHLRMADRLRQKTAKIEEINSRYDLLNSRHKSQRTMLYLAAVAALLAGIGIIGLLHYLRQKAKYEKVLSEKNTDLTRQNEEIEHLYSSLEEATRSRLAFFTNISHDLRTPLTLIAEPVEKIADREYLSPADRTLMGMVRKNVKILRRMIEQILDFRKYENGDLHLSLFRVDVAALIYEWTANFRNYAESHRIELVLDMRVDNASATDRKDGERLSFFMVTDVEKLERIYFNLLSNAMKFTPERGAVSIDCTFSEEGMVLRVADTGEGIDPESQEKIFDRFYQANTPRPRGSGIGLSLTKAFVELLGGTISVTSKRREGSVFTVRLPRIEEKATSGELETALIPKELRALPALTDIGIISDEKGKPDTTPSEDVESDGPLLLVIDDNEDLRRMMAMMMGDTYNVMEAADGKEGLRLAMKYIPDIIVCDIMMPDMDGLEVTRRLKSEKITCHIPVLILTACRLDEQRVRSYDSGADAFLSKPFSENMIKSRATALVQNRRLIFDLFLENSSSDIKPPQRGKVKPTRETLELDNEFYRDFIVIIRESFHREDLSVGEIADKLGIGPDQLTRKIKALTRKTPVDIIRGIRLQEARKKLLTTELTVAEIAYASGFASPQYFSRCFREAFGLSPTELRASVK